jgi:hypothetical protein
MRVEVRPALSLATHSMGSVIVQCRLPSRFAHYAVCDPRCYASRTNVKNSASASFPARRAAPIVGKTSEDPFGACPCSRCIRSAG